MTISVLVESEFISNFQRKANRILLLLFLVGKVQQSGLVLIAADQKAEFLLLMAREASPGGREQQIRRNGATG